MSRLAHMVLVVAACSGRSHDAGPTTSPDHASTGSGPADGAGVPSVRARPLDGAALAALAAVTVDGHEVTVAFDGEQALAMAVARPHDVALLDLGMPVMDGYAVARQLAGTAARPPLVVAISGWGDADARRRTAAAGFDHHLVKPVQWADLERVLTRG